MVVHVGQGKPNRCILIRVAQLGESEDEFGYLRVVEVPLVDGVDAGEVTRAGDRFLHLKLIRKLLLAHPYAPAAKVIWILNASTNFNCLIARFDGFSSNDNLTTVLTVALVAQVSLPGLGAGAHKITHSAVQLTYCIVIAGSITIDHDELQLLLSLEIVWHREACAEVGVERIFNLFSLPDFVPLSLPVLQVVRALVEETHRIALAKGVQIAQFPPRYKQIYLHDVAFTRYTACSYHVYTSLFSIFKY